MRKLLAVTMVVLLSAPAAWAGTDAAAFMNAGVGAKALAMGSAFVAVADDTSAIYWNPAGIGRLNKLSVMAMSQSLASTQWETLKDITPSYQFVGLTFPVNSFSVPGIGNQSNTFGLGMLSMSLSKIPYTYVDASDHIVRDSFEDAENAYYLAYGLPLYQGEDSFYAGASFKYISQQFTKIEGATATGYDMDAGLLYSGESLNLGLVIQRGAAVTWANGRTDTSPLTTKFGVSKSFSLARSLYLTAAADVVQKQNNPLSLNTGMEWGLQRIFRSRALSLEGLFLRGGVDSLVIEDRYGYRNAMNENMNYNAGFGIDVTVFGTYVQLDYVFSSRRLGDKNTIAVNLYF